MKYYMGMSEGIYRVFNNNLEFLTNIGTWSVVFENVPDGFPYGEFVELSKEEVIKRILKNGM
jgi:hypothetical protein